MRRAFFGECECRETGSLFGNTLWCAESDSVRFCKHVRGGAGKPVATAAGGKASEG
jgi:hypothetical protein